MGQIIFELELLWTSGSVQLHPSNLESLIEISFIFGTKNILVLFGCVIPFWYRARVITQALQIKIISMKGQKTFLLNLLSINLSESVM